MATLFQKRKAPIRNKSNQFFQKEVDLAQTSLFFPEEYEKTFLTLYFVSLPYLAGLMFQFFYISNKKVEIFLALNKQSSFIFTWAIGYEIIATLILLYIIKISISFSKISAQKGKKEFKRP